MGKLKFPSIHEECGICAIYGRPEASRLAYLSLQALQHRGQESSGIVSSDGKNLYTHIGMGLVADIFNKSSLDALPGRMAIGHVRYSTAGTSHIKNAQPLVAKFLTSSIAIGHNGNITNARALRKELEKNGSIFQTNSDSEVILQLIARHRKNGLESALKNSLGKITGAYSLVFQTEKEIYAVRDPWGVRPLVLGKLGRGWVIASETSAFDLVGAKLIRDIAPGELIKIGPNGLKSTRLLPSHEIHQCIFEYVYFARPDSRIFGGSVYAARREMGRNLAREFPPPKDADLVCPVPDSAVVAAVGFAEASGLPFEMAFVRSHYIGRIFIEPTQSIRDFGTKIKYNVVGDLVRGKNIVLVDDSIVRGTTSRKLVRMLFSAGAKEIHMRISSPPIVGPCFYGIDTPTQKELIAFRHPVRRIQKYLGVNSLAYLSIEGMLKPTEQNPKNFCTACFTGHYPIPLAGGKHKAS